MFGLLFMTSWDAMLWDFGQTGVVFDGVPLGKTFGQLLQDIEPSRKYYPDETVKVEFQGSNPRVCFPFNRGPQSFVLEGVHSFYH